MAQAFPYTFIACPCSDVTRRHEVPKRNSREIELETEEQAEGEKTFDPRHPRSSFSLFPPEHLLYCEECHAIKCPRCVVEEVICRYCPSCLFETPSSTVRSEGNRCNRNCFNCPKCTSQLVLMSETDAKEGPFYLSCNYCMWTTLDMSIKFDRPSNIRAQLDKISNSGGPKASRKSPEASELLRTSSLSREPLSPLDINDESNLLEKEAKSDPLDAAARFTALKLFYKDQLLRSTDLTMPNSAADLAYSSPSAIARIMAHYGTGPAAKTKKTAAKPTMMREALVPAEGLFVPVTDLASGQLVKLKNSGYADTTTINQRLHQQGAAGGNPYTRFVDELRPMPTQLRTKRSKRCKECKHILVKPELKTTSTRYRIKLVALNYVPLVSLKPLPANPNKDFSLEPAKPSQWILTLKNHLFEPVTVSLGTPSVTPGPHGHRVTILCPQFEVGANSDVWDDALNAQALKALTSPGGDQIAGKIYDRGRNWTSVVLEVVPQTMLRKEGEELDEDEDVIEVPIRVRLEWKQSEVESGKEKKSSVKALEEDVDEGKRELAYWMVLGVGRVTC